MLDLSGGRRAEEVCHVRTQQQKDVVSSVEKFTLSAPNQTVFIKWFPEIENGIKGQNLFLKNFEICSEFADSVVFQFG